MKEAKERQGYEEDGGVRTKNCFSCDNAVIGHTFFCKLGHFSVNGTATCKEWRKGE